MCCENKEKIHGSVQEGKLTRSGALEDPLRDLNKGGTVLAY